MFAPKGNKGCQEWKCYPRYRLDLHTTSFVNSGRSTGLTSRKGTRKILSISLLNKLPVVQSVHTRHVSNLFLLNLNFKFSTKFVYGAVPRTARRILYRRNSLWLHCVAAVNLFCNYRIRLSRLDLFGFWIGIGNHHQITMHVVRMFKVDVVSICHKNMQF